MVIYFVPVGLIAALLLFAVGAFYSLLKSVMGFIYGLLFAAFIIAGIAIVIFSFFRLFYKENKIKNKDEFDIQGGFLPFVSDFIFGIFVAFILPLVQYWLSIGHGTKAFKEAEYILLGTFEKIDIKTASIVVVLVLLLFALCPIIIMKLVTLKSRVVFPLISILIVSIMALGGFEWSLENRMSNSYDSINWDSAEYEVVEDTAILQSELIDNIPVITGKFSKGTKLYVIKTNIYTEPTERELVSDGNKIGLVSVDDIKSLVTYTYFVNTQARLYAKEVDRNWPSGNVIREVEEGTQVTKIKVYRYMATPPSHVYVRLSDGTEGYIEIDKITEIRE